MTNTPKYFTKARIGNIMAAVVIIWTLWMWTDIAFMFADAGAVSDVTLTILGMWNVITGFAAKHLWDSCGN